MPWQSVPPLIIIGGAFTAIGALVPLVDVLTHGKVILAILTTKAVSYDVSD